HAIVDLKEAIRVAPQYDQALYQLARTLHYETGGADLEEALTWYAQAYETAPFRRDVLSDWARLLQRLRRYGEAAAKAQMALDLSDNIDSRRLLASILRSNAVAESEKSEAIRLLEQAEAQLRAGIELAPRNAELHSALGGVLTDHALRADAELQTQ